LVEDDADTREMYAAFLELDAVHVEQARDGVEAIEKAIAIRPDVIVTDLSLPRLDAFGLCQVLKRDERTRSIPIVAVTGHVYQRDIQRAKEAGCVAVLVKPCLPDIVFREITRVLDVAYVARTMVKQVVEHSGDDRRNLARCDRRKPGRGGRRTTDLPQRSHEND
jgi:CheY-like chemotaxis protein